MSIVAIHQPNYLPWLGYFHKMMSCDLFVILDDVIHSKRAITNKNKIKGPQGGRLLSVPLANKEVLIKDVTTLDDSKWYHKHWKSLEACYTRTPYWKKYKDLFAPIYANPSVKLADLNLRLIQVIREILNIKTPMVYSSDISGLEGQKGTRIINICKHFGADIYLSGTGARSYNDEQGFRKNNLRLVYQDFVHPVYPQTWGDFIPNMSSVDLIFNCGPQSRKYLTKQVIYG